jgi:hypothetical protein
MPPGVARLIRAIDPDTPPDTLLVDLNAADAALALAGAARRCRTVLHADGPLAEWRALAALRPTTVLALEAGAAALIAAAGAALDAGWTSACAACGQRLRVAAWRWSDLAADEADPARRPIARRATCQACRALGRRGGDASALLPDEAASAASVPPAGAGDGPLARWTPRQRAVFDALHGALDELIEPAPVVLALRLAVADAALATARPARARGGRGWWEVAPWQALADAVDAQRRELITAAPLPRELAATGDQAALRFPGLTAVLVRAGAAARSGLVALAAAPERGTGSAPRVGLIRVRIGADADDRAVAAAASSWAASGRLADDRPAAPARDAVLDGLAADDPTVIAASLARIIVGMNPLLSAGPLLLVEAPNEPAALAGALAALSLAGGEAEAIERLEGEGDADRVVIRARLQQGAAAPRPAPARAPLERIVADLVVARGEPTPPSMLRAGFALRRSREGGILEPAELIAEFERLEALHERLPSAGSLERLVRVGDGRIFVDARAERERLAETAGDLADALALGAADAAADPHELTRRLQALADGAVAPEPSLRAALFDAYFERLDPAAGTAVARFPTAVRAAAHRDAVAQLLELGVRMGLYAAVSPALADEVSAGRRLAARTARDPLEASPPLRARSDRAAYDAVDAILYRRGSAILLCSVLVGPLPIGHLLLQQHAAIPTDGEVVRLLVLDPRLVPLLRLRLARDERLATAWEEQNWRLLATDQLAALGRNPAPRLASLEPHLGFEPAAREAAQLELGTFGWETGGGR